jgi:general secretion pathway protein B
MSFILDALRKSEIERQRQSGPSMAEFPVARQDRRLPVALIAIGFLLAVNLAVVLFFMLRSEKDSEPAAAATQVAAAAPASVTSPPPATAGAAAPAQAPGEATAPQDDLPVAAGAPGSVTYAQSDLYGESATQPPAAPDPTLLPDTEAAANSVIYGSAPSTEDPATVVAQMGLPPLAVDLHVFVDDPAKRAVFINGRRYTQGATIAEGPTVEQITREGAVLSYRGRRFLLPRL